MNFDVLIKKMWTRENRKHVKNNNNNTNKRLTTTITTTTTTTMKNKYGNLVIDSLYL